MSALVSFRYPLRQISEYVWQIPKDAKPGMRVPVTIYASRKLLDKMMTDRTIDQAVNVAHLQGAQKHVVLLPDAHEGYGMPVGGVLATDLDGGIISSGAVGYDINCGVRLIATNLHEKDVRPRIKELVHELFTKVPTGVGAVHHTVRLSPSQLDDVLVEGAKWAVANGYGWEEDYRRAEEEGQMKGADPTKVSEMAKRRGAPELGTLGSGNHFLEVQRVDAIFDEQAAKRMGIYEVGQITVLIHCGSRGFGHQVCSDYLRISEQAMRRYNISVPDRELVCVPVNSREGLDYRAAMHAACNYAWANRQLITHWTRLSFERVFKNSAEALGMRLVYDVAHNIAKVEEHKVNGERKQVLVHRKGATRSFAAGSPLIPRDYQDLGQPVLIPGSMGTASWVLLGHANSYELSFGTTAHGAGRMMSRSAAVRQYGDKVKQIMQEKGVYIETPSWKGAAEEVPQAYKDVDEVVETSHALKIATKVVRLVPLGVIKG
ncbi:MAG: RNA-splicing ligase RtcB [Nitrososphaerota archaeon]